MQTKKSLQQHPILSEDIKELMHVVNTEIGIAKYKISRCVNAGDFHTMLVDRRTEELQIT